MDEKLERKLNTLAYIITIFVEVIYIYVTNNEDNLSEEDASNLVNLGRTLLLIVAIYFIINALLSLRNNKSKSQYKQVIAASLALIAAYIRTTITSDNITIR